MALASALPPSEPRTLHEQVAPFDAGWLGGWLTLFDRFRQWPGAGPQVIGAADFWDRRYGHYWPFFRSEMELALYRQPARVLAGANSATIGLLYGTSHYLGCPQYKCNSRRGKKAPPELLAACQDVVDTFLLAAAYAGGERPGLEHEAFWSFAVDGEFLACLEHDGYGRTRLRAVVPEQLTQPPDTDAREWGYGVYAEPESPDEPLGYNIRWGDDPVYDRAEYEPEDVLHWRNNVPRAVKRGLTDFRFDPYTCLSLSGKIREALGEAAAQQAGIVGVRQHKGASATQMGDFTSSRQSYRVRDPYTGRESSVEWKRPGRWEEVGENSNYVDGPSAGNVPNHVQVLSECHRAGGRRYSAPDWLVSGDTSSANFATSLTAESPFVRAVLEVGRQRGEVLKLGPWRALENSARAGRLRVGGARVPWEAVQALVELTVTPPSPQTRNRLEEANRDKVYLEDLGIKSPQQVCEEQGWDFDKMREERMKAGWPDKKQQQQQQAQRQQQQAQQQPPGNGNGGPPPSGTNNPPARTSDADRPDQQAAPSVPVQPAQEQAEAPADVATDDPDIADDDEYGPKTARLYAELMADILYGLHGDSALKALRKSLATEQRAGRGCRVRMLEAKWDASLHPRGKGGRFIPKGSAEAVAGAKDSIARLKGTPATAETVKKLAGHLSILTVKQLREVHKEHGVKVPGRLRAQLVEALLQKLPGAKPEDDEADRRERITQGQITAPGKWAAQTNPAQVAKGYGLPADFYQDNR